MDKWEEVAQRNKRRKKDSTEKIGVEKKKVRDLLMEETYGNNRFAVFGDGPAKYGLNYLPIKKQSENVLTPLPKVPLLSNDVFQGESSSNLRLNEKKVDDGHELLAIAKKKENPVVASRTETSLSIKIITLEPSSEESTRTNSKTSSNFAEEIITDWDKNTPLSLLDDFIDDLEKHQTDFGSGKKERIKKEAKNLYLEFMEIFPDVFKTINPYSFSDEIEKLLRILTVLKVKGVFPRRKSSSLPKKFLFPKPEPVYLENWFFSKTEEEGVRTSLERWFELKNNLITLSTSFEFCFPFEFLIFLSKKSSSLWYGSLENIPGSIRQGISIVTDTEKKKGQTILRAMIEWIDCQTLGKKLVFSECKQQEKIKIKESFKSRWYEKDKKWIKRYKQQIVEKEDEWSIENKNKNLRLLRIRNLGFLEIIRLSEEEEEHWVTTDNSEEIYILSSESIRNNGKLLGETCLEFSNLINSSNFECYNELSNILQSLKRNWIEFFSDPVSFCNISIILIDNFFYESKKRENFVENAKKMHSHPFLLKTRVFRLPFKALKVLSEENRSLWYRSLMSDVFGGGFLKGVNQAVSIILKKKKFFWNHPESPRSSFADFDPIIVEWLPDNDNLIIQEFSDVNAWRKGYEKSWNLENKWFVKSEEPWEKFDSSFFVDSPLSGVGDKKEGDICIESTGRRPVFNSLAVVQEKNIFQEIQQDHFEIPTPLTPKTPWFLEVIKHNRLAKDKEEASFSKPLLVERVSDRGYNNNKDNNSEPISHINNGSSLKNEENKQKNKNKTESYELISERPETIFFNSNFDNEEALENANKDLKIETQKNENNKEKINSSKDNIFEKRSSGFEITRVFCFFLCLFAVSILLLVIWIGFLKRKKKIKKTEFKKDN